MAAPLQKQVRVTSWPAIKNAPLIGLAEGNGSFNNLHLAALVLGVPYYVKKWIPIVRCGGFKTYLFLVAILGVPVAIAYWTVMSTYGRRKNEKVVLPGKDIEEYISIKDPELKIHYGGKEKIPMQVFYDAYFDGKVDFKGAYLFYGLAQSPYIVNSPGDVLDIMEQRHDWATFNFTPELFKYVLTVLIPDVLTHSRAQDEEQVRGHYDRKSAGRYSMVRYLTLMCRW